MNQPIVRLFGVVIVMFAVLLAFTSRWTIFEASSLRDNPLNARALLEQQRIDRGTIVAADGTVLARSVRSSGVEPLGKRLRTALPDGRRVRARDRLLLHRPRPHGAGALSQHGAERPVATRTCRRSSTSCRARSDRATRSSRRSTRRAQQVANKALAGHEGAVVALEPRSGAVRVMASSPAYDPNDLRSTQDLRSTWPRTRTASRWSTARRSSATRRDRRSRW